MIEHELLLLGLLKESPMHGYQIKKRIKEILSLFAGVDLKSIYYPLKVLEKKALVIKHSDKQGRRPQRFVYALTPKGENYFEQLLSKSFLEFKRPQFSLDLNLYFLHYMKRRVAERRLRGRIYILNRLSKSLEQMIQSLKNKKSPSLARICEHNLKMLKAETQFLSELTKAI